MAIRTIVVGTDLRSSGERALALARQTARSTRATLWLVHAVESDSSLDELERLRKFCEQDGLSAQSSSERGEPWETILRSAQSVQADLIAVGEPQSTVGKAERALGSTAARVISKAPCSVLFACGRLLDDYRGTRLAVGVDFAPDSIEAVRWARDVAAAVDGSVALVHVESEPSAGGLSSGARSRLEQLVSTQGLDQNTTVHVFDGREVSTLSPIVEQLQADLLFVGCRGQGRQRGETLGSVTQDCLRRSKVPVIAVRA